MKKVSIITPCFNGEGFIHQYMQSVLAQDYPNIELIFVNDGSTDRTAEVVHSYEGALKEKGIEFVYIAHENRGLAAAVNSGLEVFTGDYFICPDVDDILLEGNIKNRVDFLEANSEYNMVACRGWLAEENDLDNKKPFEKFKEWDEENLFDNLIRRKVRITTINFMMRKEAFIKIFPNRQIYNNRWVQDIQLILPMAYYFKCGFLEDRLFICIIWEKSYSRDKKSYLDRIHMVEGYETAFVHTLESLDMTLTERSDYLCFIKKFFRGINNFHAILYLWERNFELQEKDESEYVLFGAGYDGKRIGSLLRKHNLKIKYYVDNNPHKVGKFIDGIEVKSPRCLSEDLHKVKILIATSQYYEEMKEQLVQMGLRENQDFIYFTDFFYQAVKEMQNDFHDLKQIYW